MKLSTKIMAALVLGVVAGLLLGEDGAGFAKTWIGLFGAIFMNMIKMMIVPMVFALFLGIGISMVGEPADAFKNTINGLAEVSYKIVCIIMEFAPIGVFGLITPVVAANGPAVLLPLLKVIIAVYLGCLLHAIFVYGGMLRLIGKLTAHSNSLKALPRHSFRLLPAAPLTAPLAYRALALSCSP